MDAAADGRVSLSDQEVVHLPILDADAMKPYQGKDDIDQVLQRSRQPLDALSLSFSTPSPSSLASPTSILDTYMHQESPTTPASDQDDEATKVIPARPPLTRQNSLTHPNRLEASVVGATLSQFATSPTPTIGPLPPRPTSVHDDDLLHTPTTPEAALRSRPSLTSVPEYSKLQNTPRRSPMQRSDSVQSLSDRDLFSSGSAQATPALTLGSSASSSRPSSFFRNSVTSTLYTSPSVESLAEVRRLSKSRTPDPFDHAGPPYSPQYAIRPVGGLEVAEHLQEPVSPSKIGLGITTDRAERSTKSAGGRQRVTRSRSSSVAERVERARSISAASSAFAPEGKQRAIGLSDNLSSDTTHWSLKDSQNSQQVLHALSSAAHYTRLVHLDISNCHLTALPVSLAGLVNLQELDVSQNPLQQRSLPQFLASLTSLQVIVADSCGLTSLPFPLSTLGRLHTLSVRHNKLRSLPSWLCHLEPTLTNLFIDGNPFRGQWADVLRPIIVSMPIETPKTPQFTEQDRYGLPALPSSRLSTSRSAGPHSTASAAASRRNSLVQPTSPTRLSPSNSLRLSGAPSSRSAAPTSRPATATASSRPSTSLGWSTESVSKVKRMRSVGDLVRGNASTPLSPDTRSRSASVSPEAMFEQAAAVSPVSASSSTGSPSTQTGTASRKKSTNFFKKLGAGLRSRKDSERAQQPPKRPAWLSEEDRSVSAPAKPPMSLSDDVDETITLGSRPRTASTGDMSHSLSNMTSIASLRTAGSFFEGDTPPPVPKKSIADTLSEGDSQEFLEEIEESQTIEGPRSALRSVLAFLRDLDDLSSADTSPGALAAALRDMARNVPTSYPKSRGNSTYSSRTSSQYDVEGYLGDSDVGRQPHSSMSTSSSNEQPGSHKFKADPAKRERVINEIVATERAYVNSLEELFDIYIYPAAQPASRTASQSSKESVIPLAERKIVFSNAENLMQFHKTAFLPDLEHVVAQLSRQRESTASDTSALSQTLRDSAEEIARVFLRHGAFLKMYTIYVNNFDTAHARFQTWTSKSTTAPPAQSLSATARLVAASSVAATAGTPHQEPVNTTNTMSTQQKKRVRAFLKQCREHPKHSQMNCESYLLMPVQRIPRYKMLLEALLACTPLEEASGLYPNPVIAAALDLASNLASDLNEKKRESEGRQRLLYWQTRIGNKFKSPLVQPHRMLIKESTMVIERVVKRSSEFVSVDSTAVEPSMVQVHSLRVDVQQKPVIALLTSDILVLINEPQGPSSPVDLFTVIRLGQSTKGQCASVFGNKVTLRLTDSRAILYLRLPSSSDTLAWAAAINSQVLSF